MALRNSNKTALVGNHKMSLCSIIINGVVANAFAAKYIFINTHNTQFCRIGYIILNNPIRSCLLE